MGIFIFRSKHNKWSFIVNLVYYIYGTNESKYLLIVV